MKNSIQILKKDFEVIDAIGIYNLTSNALSYSDKNLGSISLINSMNDNGCFEKFDFSYLETIEGLYFIRKGANNLAIAKLKHTVDLNKVLFELRVKEFCDQLN